MSEEFSTVPSGLEREASVTSAPGIYLDIKRLLSLRLPLMIGVALVLAVALVPIAWYTVPLTYTATAQLQFLSVVPRVLSSEGATQSPAYSQYLNTQLSLISGNTILSRVLDHDEVRILPEIQTAESPLAYLKEHVSARGDRGSELASVSCTMLTPDAAKTVLNAVIEEYMDYALEEEAVQGGERLRILMRERDSRQAELDLINNQMADARRQIGVPVDSFGMTQAQSPLELYRDRLASAEENRDLAQLQVDDIQARLDDINRLYAKTEDSPGAPITEFQVEERVQSDPRVSQLRQTLLMENVRISGARYVEGSPLYENAQSKLESLEESIAKTEAMVRLEVLSGLQAAQAQELESALKALKEGEERVAKYESLVEEQEEQQGLVSAQLVELGNLQDKANTVNSLLQSVNRTIEAIQVESNAPARVRVAALANVPANPDYSKRFSMAILAFLASMGAGAGAGLLRELTDQHIRSAKDLARVTPLPVMAAVPDARDDKLPKGLNLQLLTAEAPDSHSAEEFRRVLPWLLYPKYGDMSLETVCITSPTQGDGKTTLACNEAIALAHAGNQVLLVDCSSRRPMLEGVFGLEASEGLAEVLRHGIDPQALVRETFIDNVFVLGPGLDSAGVGGMLASQRFTKVLSWADNAFDYVIIDTPPSLLMSDAKLIAPLVDGVVIAVGVKVSTLGMVHRCLRDMERVGANVVGVVVNRTRRMRGGYYRKNLQLYYDYPGQNGNGKPGHGRYPLPEMRVLDETPEEAPDIVLEAYSNADDNAEETRRE